MFNNPVYPGGTASSSTIGGLVIGGTVGSILFVGAGSTLAQDNANLFWDDTTNQLELGLGLVGTPAYSFVGDTNTGIFSPGADQISIVTAGATRIAVDATGDVIITQGVSTTGSPVALTLTGAAHTTLTASVEARDVNFNLARTVQFATGALASQRAFAILAPTYGFVGASIVTNAATFYIDAAPVAGANATLSNSWSLWVDAGRSRFDDQIAAAAGSDAAPSYTFQGSLGWGMFLDSNLAFTTAGVQWFNINSTGTTSVLGLLRLEAGTAVAPTLAFSTATTTGLFQDGTDAIGITTAGVARMTINLRGDTVFTQGVGTTGSPTTLTVTGGAHTTLAASTEATDINFNLARTVQFATGALTTQRAFVVQSPTYGFVGGSTITTAVTHAITAAPTAGTNTTVTASYASQVGGTVTIGPTSAGLLYAAINVPTHTVTVTGTTQVTSVGPSAMRLGIVTVTDASAVTIDTASTLYIAGAVTQAGSVTITSALSLWVDAGASRFDGAVVLSAGVAGTPALTTLGDLNTGIFFSAADTVDVSTAGVARVSVGPLGNTTIIQGAHTTGSPTLFLVRVANNTGLTASTEAIMVDVDMDATATFATGALTLQRNMLVRAPTMAFVGSSTLTTSVVFAVEAAMGRGQNTTITNSYAAQFGGTANIGPTSADQTYAAIDVPAHTVTVTGTTQVTSVGLAAVRLGIVTVTDASAVTIDTAATLYIAGAVLQANLVTITTPYSIWVDAGASRFDGALVLAAGTASLPTLTKLADLNTGIFFPADEQVGISSAGTERLRIDNTSTATQTALLIYDVDNATLERVTVGVADSGGAGFKLLRIAN